MVESDSREPRALMAVEPFEHLMYADDRPEHPMCFAVRLTVTGRLDRARFAAAGTQALARHPLLRARLVGNASARRGELRWQIEPAAFEVIDLPAGASTTTALAENPIVPGRGPMIRACLGSLAADGGTEITFIAHHAATDALGVTAFVEDLLLLYGDQPERLRPLDATLLSRRGSFHMTPSEWRARRRHDQARTWLFARQRPQPLARGDVAAGARVRSDSAAETLNAGAVADLRHAAGRAGATVNDLLLRDYFLTLDDWNRQHPRNGRSGRRRLRIAMPMNMRLAGDEAVPAANIVSMCFLDRRGSDLDDPSRLLRGLAAETRRLKTMRLGLALIYVAETLGRVRHGLRLLMNPRGPGRCAASAVLSNLGDPWAGSRLPRDAEGYVALGGLVVTRLELLPPVRPGTALAVGAVRYAGSLTLTAHFDCRSLSLADGRALLTAFVGRLVTSRDLEAAMFAKTTKAGKDAAPLTLEQLLAKHAARRPTGASFRSLPIGKNVAVAPPDLEPRLTGASRSATPAIGSVPHSTP